MLTATLTIGVVVSVILTELTGLGPGGIIVPGYVALILDRPATLLGLLGVTTATYWTVRLLSGTLFLYGSRQFSFTVLIGLAFSVAAQLLRAVLPVAVAGVVDWPALGYIVPALLAHQWARQGVWPTLLMLAISAPLVRLLAILILQ